METGAVLSMPILLTAGAAMFGSWVITLDPVFSGLGGRSSLEFLPRFPGRKLERVSPRDHPELDEFSQQSEIWLQNLKVIIVLSSTASEILRLIVSQTLRCAQGDRNMKKTFEYR